MKSSSESIAALLQLLRQPFHMVAISAGVRVAVQTSVVVACLAPTRCGGGSLDLGAAGVVVLMELDCGLSPLALRATTA